jgi:hypothetical protein
MKLNVRYPVAFESEVPRHRVMQTVIGFSSADVTIPTLSTVEAPIMITVDDIDNQFGVKAGTEYRLHGGRLLVDTGLAPPEFDGAGGLHGKNLLTLPLLDHIAFRYGMSDRAHIYPPRALQVVTGLIWNGGIRKELTETSKAMIEAGRITGHEDDLTHWREMLERSASSFAVIDGTVWREASEPCYTIDARRPPGLTTREASFFSRIRNGTLETRDWSALREEGRNFSCLDRNRAYRFAHRVAEARGFDEDFNFPRIDVLSADLPVLDFEAHEFERTARLLVYDVADGFRKIAHGKGVDFFYAVPAYMMEAFIDARDCLEGMNATNGVTLEQEQKFQMLVDRVNEAAENGLRYTVKMDMAEVNDVFDDWLSREVSVDSIVSMTVGGGRI